MITSICDEYQDTNGSQEELLKLIAFTHRNICVVGDDDQSIYGWRGADVERLFASFPRGGQGQRRSPWSENYRSTEEILRVANNVIRASKEERQEKGAPSCEARREKTPELVAFGTASEEAEWVARFIDAEIKAGRRSPGDFCCPCERSA